MATKSTIANNTFMFTGTLTSLTRAEAERLVKENGGTILSGVTAKLNILVVGEDTGSKLEKAKKLGTVKILTEREFLKLVPKAAGAAAKTQAAKTPTKKVKAAKAASSKVKTAPKTKAAIEVAKSKSVRDEKFSSLRLGRTENQIVYADFKCDNVDLNQVKQYLQDTAKLDEYVFDNIFAENGLLTLEQGANDYTDFFQLFNPEVLFAVFRQPYEGFVEINYCEDPTAYIYDDCGNLFKNLTVSLSRGDGEFAIGLKRDHTYYYDDIEDMTDSMMKKIKKIMEKDDADKTWEEFTLPTIEEMTLDEFKTHFYSIFKKKDIWL
jgi:hypothetical protein